jgi:hypothetical protein
VPPGLVEDEEGMVFMGTSIAPGGRPVAVLIANGVVNTFFGSTDTADTCVTGGGVKACCCLESTVGGLVSKLVATDNCVLVDSCGINNKTLPADSVAPFTHSEVIVVVGNTDGAVLAVLLFLSNSDLVVPGTDNTELVVNDDDCVVGAMFVTAAIVPGIATDDVCAVLASSSLVDLYLGRTGTTGFTASDIDGIPILPD